MKKTFIGKNNKPYSVSDLEIINILKNDELLSNYTMKELDDLYKKYFGSYIHEYINILRQKIILYDKSSEVNGFYINGMNFWLDKNTRVGLAHLADCTEGTMQLVLGGTILEIESSVVKDILAQIERYAAQCYLQTQKHLIAIKELKTVEDMINYDNTKGYPEKLTFTV